MSGRTITQWLRAIDDCGLLRVRFDDDALISGIERGLIASRPVEGDEDALDVWLTERGKAFVAERRAA